MFLHIQSNVLRINILAPQQKIKKVTTFGKGITLNLQKKQVRCHVKHPQRSI